ncbi:MAG: hypothetical protein EAX90_02345 [Candidatus Heimdallarchaeota archaeon]|nr:hypothetical protein [Candidatus Heimdallarchaeota archaeon]
MSQENSDELPNVDLSTNDFEDQTTDDFSLLEEGIFIDKSKKFTFRSFLKTNGFTLTFLVLSAIVMIIGLILFYWLEQELVKNAGFWLIISGVAVFLLTIILGFQKLE